MTCTVVYGFNVSTSIGTTPLLLTNIRIDDGFVNLISYLLKFTI